MKQTNWEKEFDKKFINGEDYFNYKSIKHFIADLLEEQKKELHKEIDQIIDGGSMYIQGGGNGRRIAIQIQDKIDQLFNKLNK